MTKKLTLEDLKDISVVKFEDKSGEKYFDTVFKVSTMKKRKDGKIYVTSGFLKAFITPLEAIDVINDLSKNNKIQITYNTPSTNRGYKTYKPKHSVKSPRNISQLKNSVRKMF